MSDTGTRPEGPLHEAGLLEDASVYHALWQASTGRVTPRDADHLEVWEIAVLLGHAHELDTPEERRRRGQTPAGLDERAAARNRARLAAARGEGPEPEAEPLDPAALAQLTNTLNRSA